MSDTRNPDYPFHERWDNCDHEWRETDYDNAVRCTKCGCPGEKEDVGVYWPAT